MSAARDRGCGSPIHACRGASRISACPRPSGIAAHKVDRGSSLGSKHGSKRRSSAPEGRYERIYAIVCQIPPGRVATYGQVAAIEGNITARIVGYALASLDHARQEVPWQRVINRSGEISERRGGGGTDRQRSLLESEGVVFDARGRLDFDICGWDGPDIDWLHANECHFSPRRS
ncbi:MGMT family protein [Thioalkalivibrio sp. HK1]|uniref:MGMT family protein n=1 Tax=Thioalkalivibrio sp. HK1 TaxID=1469245 RepID=UPI0009DF497D|nr:MGMT family protein [Thioalkalivibrio sp. HK1]